MEFYTEVVPKQASSPLSRAGTTIQFSDLKDYADACKAVKEEYKARLHGGSVGTADFEALWEEAVAKVYAAGFEQIKAYAEEQLDILRTQFPAN